MTTTTKTPAALNVLQISAGVAALAATGQAVLGFMMSAGNFSVASVHASIGGIALVASLVAGVAGFLWRRASGNTGLAAHAAGMAVLGLVQFGLGELGGGLVMVHIGLGVLFLVGAVGLVTLAVRKPGTATA